VSTYAAVLPFPFRYLAKFTLFITDNILTANRPRAIAYCNTIKIIRHASRSCDYTSSLVYIDHRWRSCLEISNFIPTIFGVAVNVIPSFKYTTTLQGPPPYLEHLQVAVDEISMWEHVTNTPHDFLSTPPSFMCKTILVHVEIMIFHVKEQVTN
jgi:hypothetical protein